MHYAQHTAGKALVFGKKSVEVCQGFILLSLYPAPARRWADDRSWIYLGLAIRYAVIASELDSVLTESSEWQLT